MIYQLKKLTKNEMELLLKAPALLSIFASSEDHDTSKVENADTIQLAHFKTFTAHPILIEYYREVEKIFKKHFEETIKKYVPFNKTKREALGKEIDRLNNVIAKLDADYATTLNQSLKGYAEHVKKSNESLLMNFILPISIKGLTN